MPLSHKTHPLITGTLLLTAAGLLFPGPRLFLPDLSLPDDRCGGTRNLPDDLPSLRNLFLPLRRVDPDRHLPLYRSGPGPCEADAALWLFFILRHVSGRRLCDPALLGPSCGTCPHGTAVCPAALRHGLRDSVYLCPCLHMRVLLRKRKSLRPCGRPAF